MYQECCAYISQKSALLLAVTSHNFLHSEEASDLQSTKAKFESRSDHQLNLLLVFLSSNAQPHVL